MTKKILEITFFFCNFSKMFCQTFSKISKNFQTWFFVTGEIKLKIVQFGNQWSKFVQNSSFFLNDFWKNAIVIQRSNTVQMTINCLGWQHCQLWRRTYFFSIFMEAHWRTFIWNDYDDLIFSQKNCPHS